MRIKRILISVLLIVLGSLICAFHHRLVTWLVYFIAAIIILFGIFRISEFFKNRPRKPLTLVIGLMEIGVSIPIIIFADEVIQYAMIALGIYFVWTAISGIISLKTGKTVKGSQFAFLGAVPLMWLFGSKHIVAAKGLAVLFDFILGALLIAFPFVMTAWFIILTGVFIIVGGFVLLLRSPADKY